MKLVGRKTRRAIEKSVAKVIKKHGPMIATGIAASLASSLATLLSSDSSGSGTKGRKGKVSTLASLLPKQVTDMFPGGDSKKKSRTKQATSRRKPKRSGKSEGDGEKKQSEP